MAVAISVVHIIWPDLKIDAITLTLVILAIVPWMAPIFKSLEFPGGWKLEFQEELARVRQEAEVAGLIDSRSMKNNVEYGFMEIAESNPGLAMAGLRIEIEKSLKAIAKHEGIEFKRYGINFLIRGLYEKQIISNQEKAALADIIGTLNRAVHGEELDYHATLWVIDIGPQILSSLNKKIVKAS